MEKLNDYVWQLWDIKFLYDEDMNATEDRAVAENKDSDDDSDDENKKGNWQMLQWYFMYWNHQQLFVDRL